MIFEVPLDHFPAQQQISRTNTRQLRLSSNSLPNKEIHSHAVAPMSPSVRRTQFNFSQQSTEKAKSSLPTAVRASIPPLKRALTSPALPVQHLNLNNLRKGSTPSTASRTNSVTDLLKCDLLKMPSRLLTNTVSLHHLA